MPYEGHPVFEHPPHRQPIWRYMGFDKLLWMIKKEKIHFHRVGDFGDQFEGTIPKAMNQLRERWIREYSNEAEYDDEEIIEMWEYATKITQSIVFANSWHSNDRESAAMWSQYGPAGKSIAIKSTVGNLIQAVEPIEKPVFVGSMSYVDFYSKWDELSGSDKETLYNHYGRTGLPNLFYSSLLKRNEFSYENELRAVIADVESLHMISDDSDDNRVEIRDPPNDFHNCPIDLDHLIREVYVAPSAASWFFDTVKHIVDDSHLSLTEDDVYFSDMNQQPWH